MVTVVFRVDASLKIGSGHVMRCLTLAQAMSQQGWSIHFACRQHEGHLIELIQRQGYPVLAMLPPPPSEGNSYQDWLGVSEAQDACELEQLLPGNPDVLVVDHYGLSIEFEQRLSKHCRLLLAIDDLANRPHQCHLLLDQNLYPNADSRYSDKVSPETTLMLGPEFALIRPEFFQNRRTPPQDEWRLLVFFGGSDQLNLTSLTVKALSHLKNYPFSADIVVGQAYSGFEDLKKLCQGSEFRLHRQISYMAELMSNADLMIGAGGSTHWERCAAQLPALVVILAENQRESTEYLTRLGACTLLGQGVELTESRLLSALTELLEDPERLQRMSEQAAAVVPKDGGCLAVIEQLQLKLSAANT